MPYVDNQGVRIHYHVEGEGPPLVVLHGLTGNLRQLHELGYAQGLKDHFELILIDSRGHGKSDKPHEPQAYSSEIWASDVVAVLDELGIDKAHYYGYSMGGWIGWCLAKHYPDRFHSFVIGGQHPYKKDNPEEWTRRVGLYERGMEDMVADIEEATGVPVTPIQKSDLLANDTQALIAVAIAMRDSSGIEEELASMTLPFLLIGGELDGYYAGMKRVASIIPDVTFVSLPDFTHIDALNKSDLLIPHIVKFLERMIQSQQQVAQSQGKIHSGE